MAQHGRSAAGARAGGRRRTSRAAKRAAPRTVRIGITGHRSLTDVKRLTDAIDRALDRIQEAWPGHLPVALSPLAEGADRLVAERILARPHGRMIATLPLPIHEYMHDFPSRASRAKFVKLLGAATETVVLPRRRSRDAAYRAVGRYVVQHCDVLVAVWDGQRPQGRGGTGEIVAWARARGKPLVIVRAGNRVPGTAVGTSLGAGQGRILVERLPGKGEP